MSKKIIGATVGTPTSPKKIEDEIKPVKTVNGKEPDENGNIAVEKPTYTAKDVGALPADTKIPSKTSELDNDSGFIMKTVSDLANYYLKSETLSKTEINALVSAIPKFAIQVVNSLPTSNISATTVYLLKSGTDSDLYTEYIYVNGAWEILGSQKVDLTGYALKEEIPTKLSELSNDSGYITKAVSDLVNYYKKSEVYSKDEIDKKGFLTEHQDISGKLDANKLPEAVNSALAQAKASGEFDGEDGKSAYEYAKDGGYTGTEAEFAEMLASVESIPSYWVEALEDGAKAINTALCEAGANKSAFLFYTDAHWGYGSGMSPKLLKHLGKHTGINKTIFGGDFGNTYEDPDTGKTMDDWMDVMREWKLAVRDIPNHHSVVGNHDKDITAINNDKGLYGFLFAPEESNDIVWGGDFYYYIDDKSEKTRYLYLNTGLCDFSDEQCKFFIEALKTTPAEWHIVAASHIWFVYADTSTPTVGSVPTNIQKVLNLFDAYNARATGSMTIDTESNVYDFKDCAAWVEFCIGGHTHVDYNFTSTNGIPVILCQTDSKHLRGNQYTYTDGTTTEAAVSGIVADYDAKKIKVIRVGRGESREIEITNYIVNYTNVLSLAIDTDGQPFQNGKGYATDSRIGSGGLYIGNQPDRCVTGYIPVDATKDIVVCMKNVSMRTDSSYISNLGFALWNSTFGRTVFIGLNHMYDDLNSGRDWYKLVLDGTNVIGFTIKANSQPAGSVFLTLGCDVIDDTSIITINEPIE